MSASVSKNASEFDPGRPFGSLLEVLRGIFLAPKRFFVGFSTEGPLREPILFVLLVSAVGSAVGALLSLVLGGIFDEVGARDVVVTLVQAVAATILGPVIVAVLSGAYLLSIRTFVGPTGNFREVYRLLSYAYGAMILFWVPGIGAFFFTYAMLVLVGLGVRYVYRASFLVALITALVGYLPSAMLFIFLQAYVTGLAFG